MSRVLNLRIASIACLTLLTSCQRVPQETTIPPASACPAPKIDTKSWQTVTLADCGIRMKLPNSYGEHRHEVVVNNWVGHSYQAGNFETIEVSLESAQGPNTTLAQNKIIRQKDYEGYTECTELINGREAILQSYRGGGSITDGTHEFRTYSVYGLFELKTGVLLRISGSTSSRTTQEEVLAALRTVTFIEGSNQSMEPIASRRIIQVCMSLTRQSAAARALARGGSSLSR
jgi:hypothetical protein